MYKFTIQKKKKWTKNYANQMMHKSQFQKFTVKNFNLEIFYDWFCGPGSHMSMHTNGNKHSITSNVKKYLLFRMRKSYSVMQLVMFSNK